MFIQCGQDGPAAPPTPVIPLPFMSNGRRMHRFAPTTVSFVFFLFSQEIFYLILCIAEIYEAVSACCVSCISTRECDLLQNLYIGRFAFIKNREIKLVCIKSCNVVEIIHYSKV